MKHDLPPHLDVLLRELDAVLGADLVGIILFGSWATGAPDDRSDIDLAVVVSDSNADRARVAVYQVVDRSRFARGELSISVESYLRLKEFLGIGDPFAWVVTASGRVLHDRSGLLERLQGECKARSSDPVSPDVVPYLQSKARSHLAQAQQAYWQFLSSTQLSTMAAAQAAAVAAKGGSLSFHELVDLAVWENMHELLRGTFPDELLTQASILAKAHKSGTPDQRTGLTPTALAALVNALHALDGS